MSIISEIKYYESAGYSKDGKSKFREEGSSFSCLLYFFFFFLLFFFSIEDRQSFT